ncbi:hypothetical protein J8F10_08860 [Gemmata sp. G18]|uniref:Bacteriophage tail tape measure C-terminal domain-containing protein n=1 Tax=Gemmata palustris TaxID=2822762 RepID=A0ABS5BNT6_9BACT|nr:hypothetical protein [Gemmata palustris]MBP3955389.1 hypothetical protein [Gemmata palustris]
MTDVGELKVRISADAAQLERGLKKANDSVQQAAGSMGTSLATLKSQFAALVPALSVVAFAQFAKGAFDAADHINDMAQRTGFLGSTLSALNIPLQKGGSSLDEFSGSIARMNAMIGEAAKGTNEGAVKAFDTLGLSVKALAQLSPEQQFYEIAAALGRVGSQSELTEKGVNIFGRSFATLIPLIKDSKGDVAAFVDEAKNLGNALTDEQLSRIDDLGDRWTESLERMRLKLLDIVPLVESLSNLPDYLGAAFVEIPFQAGQAIGNRMKGGNPNVSENRPDSVDYAVFMGDEAQGPAYRPNSAKGSNDGLLGQKEREAAAKKIAEAKKALDEYNLSLMQENEILQQSPREQAALEARFKTEEIARRGGIKATQEMIEANEELARTNYDLAESMQQAARFQQELHDKLSATLTDVVFKAGSAKEAMLGFAESIARAAFEKKVAGPLADALIGTGGGKGLMDDAIGGLGSIFGGFFADGGRPPVGIPSVVGERGPEIFVPDSAGTVIPNHQMGGSTVIVQQTIQVNPGVPELINARIREAAPAIAAHAQSSVFAALEKGGAESQLARLRS